MEIYSWSIIWNFFDLTQPQRPLLERVPYISDKLEFWQSIPQKMTSIGYFGVNDDQTIRIKPFFWENWPLEAVEVAEAAEVHEAEEVSNAWKITTEDFRVFQILEFNNLRTLFCCFEKQIFWQNHQKLCWILAPFLLEAIEDVWGQKSFKWWIKHKFPLLRKPLSIGLR